MNPGSVMYSIHRKPTVALKLEIDRLKAAIKKRVSAVAPRQKESFSAVYT